MKLLPYFKWFPSDAESDEKYAAMSMAERGLFHTAMNYSWINDGLPVDPVEVARVLRVPIKEFNKLWVRVSICFIGSERLRNPRQEVERQGAISVSKERSKAGFEGGKKKAIAKQMPEVCQPFVDIRAYGSVSEYESVSQDSKKSEEIRKNALAELVAHDLKPLENSLTVEELEAAWERHKKHRAEQPMVNVFRMVHSHNGKFEAGKFRKRHPVYCEYWNSQGWRFCPLSFWDWIEAGMPEPPTESQVSPKSKTDIEFEKFMEME